MPAIVLYHVGKPKPAIFFQLSSPLRVKWVCPSRIFSNMSQRNPFWDCQRDNKIKGKTGSKAAFNEWLFKQVHRQRDLLGLAEHPVFNSRWTGCKRSVCGRQLTVKCHQLFVNVLNPTYNYLFHAIFLISSWNVTNGRNKNVSTIKSEVDIWARL